MYKNILIPVLLDDAHDPQSAYKVAQTLADADARFTVIHVLEDIPTYVAAEIPLAAVAPTKVNTEQRLATSAAALPGAHPVVVSGHAGRAILEHAAQNGTDCIVLASHRPGLQDFFLGSTASRVVRHATCAVHVLR